MLKIDTHADAWLTWSRDSPESDISGYKTKACWTNSYQNAAPNKWDRFAK